MTLLSPDCRDGNHKKCDTVAWDVEADDYAGCECSDCNHEGTGPQ
jgi:hypothetical protein